MTTLLTQNKKLVFPIGLGTMPISAFYFPQPTKKEAIQLLITAMGMGYNFIDTAMGYGNQNSGECEELVGKALSSLDRESFFISTKCGVVLNNGIFSLGCKREHILSDCNDSLKRLKTNYLDVLFIHRIDPNTPLEESLLTLVELKKCGKIRYLGISEVDAEILQRAINYLSSINETLDFIQNEYSIASNQDENNRVLDLCEEHHINYVAYSPLSRGLLANLSIVEDKFIKLPEADLRHHLPRFANNQHFLQNKKLVAELNKIAEMYSATISQIALSWILYKAEQHHINIFPIPGTKRTTYLQENYKAAQIKLTSDSMQKIDDILTSYHVQGSRWPESIVDFKVRKPLPEVKDPC